ncbi:hypothetical protein [Companilactobacillus bobalius]|nr:hypothetical protein [Companilactobacillus bobalius]
MDDSISGWALQLAVEILGYSNVGEIYKELLKLIYDLAEDLDD